MFSLQRLIAIAAIVLTVTGGVGGLYLKIRHDAFQDGYDRARIECEAQRKAMEEANRKAIEEAAKRLVELETELTQKETRLDDLLKALDLAADQELDASAVCLSTGSVRRLEAIR